MVDSMHVGRSAGLEHAGYGAAKGKWIIAEGFASGGGAGYLAFICTFLCALLIGTENLQTSDLLLVGSLLTGISVWAIAWAKVEAAEGQVSRENPENEQGVPTYRHRLSEQRYLFRADPTDPWGKAPRTWI